MGVDITYFTMWGVYLDMNGDFIDEFHEGDFTHVGSKPRIEPICQSNYKPQFMVLGEVLWSADKYEENSKEEIDPATLPALEEKFRAEFAEQYPKWVHLIEGKPFRLVCFNTFS